MKDEGTRMKDEGGRMKENQNSECGWKKFILHPSAFILCFSIAVTFPPAISAALSADYPTRPVRLLGVSVHNFGDAEDAEEDTDELRLPFN